MMTGIKDLTLTRFSPPPDKGPNTFGINDRDLEVNETAALYFLLLKLSESGLTEVRAIAFQQLMGG